MGNYERNRCAICFPPLSHSQDDDRSAEAMDCRNNANASGIIDDILVDAQSHS